jgi:hypothetical protein
MFISPKRKKKELHWLRVGLSDYRVTESCGQWHLCSWANHKMSCPLKKLHSSSYTGQQSNIFLVFFSIFNQIDQFLCHWMPKLRAYKCSLCVKSKGTTNKTHWKRMNDTMFQKSL